MNETNIFKSIPDIRYEEKSYGPEEAGARIKVFKEIVNSRRSVRVFDNVEVPEQVIEDCLDMALKAPNSSNLQPTEFYWVREKNNKASLVEACFSQPAASTAAELVVCVARTKTWKQNCKKMLETFKVEEGKGERIPKSAWYYYQKLAPIMYNQGFLGVRGKIKKIIITAVGVFRVVPREPNSQEEMKLWATKSSALACENFMLAARAYGYDTCPMEGYDARRIRKLLKLPSDAAPVMVISIGKRSSKGIYGPQIRFPRESFIFKC